MNTTWNLAHLYKKSDDPQIEKDIRKTERLFKDFEKKYRNKKDWFKTDSKLYGALVEYEQLIEKSMLSKPDRYFGFLVDLNSSDAVAEAESNKLSMRYAKLQQHIVFFELVLGTLPEALQKKYVASKKLSRFKHFLTYIFLSGKHTLSEPEEKICTMKRLVARDLWVNGVSKTLAQKTVVWKGESIPLSSASQLIPQLPVNERRALYSLFTEKLKEVGEFAESEMNAVYLNKKIDDELRGYKEPWDSTLLGHEISGKTVKALERAVEKNLSISHDFYELKRKMLGLDHLEYSDRNVDISTQSSVITFPQAHALFRLILETVHPTFVAFYDDMFTGGRVDVFPKKGKTSGAYCAGTPGMPTYVLLNHVDTFNSAMTLAHEMGHAFHTDLAKSQPHLYQGYSTATAEVASTFFEALMFEHVYERASDDEKKVLLHNKIQDDTQTIFRQMACFSFEKELHARIRAKGSVQKEEMAALMNESVAKYLGPSMKLHPDDGYFFVYWSHIRNFFYVYTYAFGQIVSKALLAEYKKNPAFIEKVITFLKAGGSDTPENIFKSIGIDVTKPDFFEKGLNLIREDVERLRALTQK